MISREIVFRNLTKLVLVWAAVILMVQTSAYYANLVVERQIRSSALHSLKAAEEHIDNSFHENTLMLLSTTAALQYTLEQSHTQSLEDIPGLMAFLSNWFMNLKDTRAEFLHLYAWIHGQFVSGDNWEMFTRGWKGIRGDDDEDAPPAGTVGVSEVYHNLSTGQPAVTISTVIPSSKNPATNHGTVSLDVDIQDIVRKMHELYFSDGSSSMLLDKNLCFISYIDDPGAEAAIIGKSLTDLSPDHGELAARLAAGETEINSQRAVNSLGVETVNFYRRMENGWVIGMSTPVLTYYWDVYCMVGLLALIGLVMAVTASVFILRLSQAQVRADEENKSKSSFLARMSHEIRTPMNSILGMAEIMLRKRVPRDILENISIIKHSGENLLSIINDILDFSKIESGKFSLDPRRYALSSVINDAINLIRVQLAEKKNIDFLVYVDSRIPAYLVGDDVRVRQILLNLLSNAVKYTNEGFISLKIHLNKATAAALGLPERHWLPVRGEVKNPDEGQLQLIFQVKDTGCGIRKEDLSALFTEFKRLDYVRKQRVEGSGLGLVIANTFCRMMGGNVTVESEFGHGSTFTAVMNQGVADWMPLATVRDPESKQVLFYEPRPLLELSLRMALADLGVSFEAVESLRDFLTRIEDKNFQSAFVPSRYIMECVGAFGREGVPPALTAMVEMGEFHSLTGVKSLPLPVYSVNLANSINGSENALDEHRMWRRPFSAPDAMVLIVDDIATNLRVAKELIAHYGVAAHTCLSGAEALNLVRKKCYDVVFMDHMMPEMDGMEAAAAIRALGEDDPYFQTLPLVALTANVVSGQREKFLQNNFDDFLTKPIEMSKLDQILRRWIPRYKQQAQLSGDDSGRVESLEMEMPGINVKKGLRNAGGSVSLYMDILADFQRDAWKRMAQIKTALERSDSKGYIILVHGVKGSAKTLGAEDLGALAEKLEKAAATGDKESVDAESPLLLYQMEQLAERIGVALRRREEKELTRPDSPEPADDLYLDARALKLDQLKAGLEKMDITAVNYILLEYSGAPLKGPVRNFIAEIEQHILNFEYTEAVEKIKPHLRY